MKTTNVQFNAIRLGRIETSFAKFTQELSPANSIISSDGLDIQLISTDSLRSAFVSPIKYSGKHYLEVEFTNSGSQIVGFTNGSNTIEGEYSDSGSMVLFGNGNLFINPLSQSASSISKFYPDDGDFYGAPNVVGIAIDFDNETVFWSINGDYTNTWSTVDYINQNGAQITCSRTNSNSSPSFHIRTEDEALFVPSGYTYWK
jgi:hypothetical protein